MIITAGWLGEQLCWSELWTRFSARATADEQESGESLEQLLAEEEPGTALDIDDEQPEDITGDEDAGDKDVDGSSSMTARTPGRPGW